MQALLHHFRYICSFVVNDPFLPLVLPEAFQAVVETDGAVAQKEPHVAAHVGDEAAPLVGVVVDLLVEPGADLINFKNNSLSLSHENPHGHKNTPVTQKVTI